MVSGKKEHGGMSGLLGSVLAATTDIMYGTYTVEVETPPTAKPKVTFGHIES